MSKLAKTVQKEQIIDVFRFFGECIAPKRVGDIDRPEMTKARMRSIRFHYSAWSNQTAFEVYRAFVLEVADAGVTRNYLEMVSKRFARMVITILITQRQLDDYVHLATHLPYYGLPSVDEILNGEV